MPLAVRTDRSQRLLAATLTAPRPATERRNMMPGGLLTDLYELNMAVSYLRRGMTGPATFSLFVRDLPPTGGS
jgi:hypothetical protein